MGILAKLFGATEVIKEGMQLIDDMHTSTEEEIVAKTNAKVAIMQSYAPFKIAQRVLAIMFATAFLSCFIMTLGFTLFGGKDPDKVIDVVNQFWIGEIMITIVGFYFGGGFVEGMLEKRNATGAISKVKL